MGGYFTAIRDIVPEKNSLESESIIKKRLESIWYCHFWVIWWVREHIVLVPADSVENYEPITAKDLLPFRISVRRSKWNSELCVLQYVEVRRSIDMIGGMLRSVPIQWSTVDGVNLSIRWDTPALQQGGSKERVGYVIESFAISVRPYGIVQSKSCDCITDRKASVAFAAFTSEQAL